MNNFYEWKKILEIREDAPKRFLWHIRENSKTSMNSKKFAETDDTNHVFSDEQSGANCHAKSRNVFFIIFQWHQRFRRWFFSNNCDKFSNSFISNVKRI